MLDIDSYQHISKGIFIKISINSNIHFYSEVKIET